MLVVDVESKNNGFESIDGIFVDERDDFVFGGTFDAIIFVTVNGFFVAHNGGVYSLGVDYAAKGFVIAKRRNKVALGFSFGAVGFEFDLWMSIDAVDCGTVSG